MRKAGAFFYAAAIAASAACSAWTVNSGNADKKCLKCGKLLNN
jgi:hypothetical protein